MTKKVEWDLILIVWVIKDQIAWSLLCKVKNWPSSGLGLRIDYLHRVLSCLYKSFTCTNSQACKI